MSQHMMIAPVDETLPALVVELWLTAAFVCVSSA
jgi:hypothetical protein